MPEIFDRVIVLNLVANTLIFYFAARLYLLPLITRVRPQQILVPILILHSTRHLGVMFLTRGQLIRDCHKNSRIRPRLEI
jgi:hypothetical protein